MPEELAIEWKSKAFFAEVAEALGINTDQIMALAPMNEKRVVALYTTGDGRLDDDEGDLRLWSVVIARDAQGVPVLMGPPVERIERLAELRRMLADIGISIEQGGD